MRAAALATLQLTGSECVVVDDAEVEVVGVGAGRYAPQWLCPRPGALIPRTPVDDTPRTSVDDAGSVALFDPHVATDSSTTEPAQDAFTSSPLSSHRVRRTSPPFHNGR